MRIGIGRYDADVWTVVGSVFAGLAGIMKMNRERDIDQVIRSMKQEQKKEN